MKNMIFYLTCKLIHLDRMFEPILSVYGMDIILKFVWQESYLDLSN